jgi:hypothetical protein
MPRAERTAFPLLGALPPASGWRPSACGRGTRNPSHGRLATGSGSGPGAGRVLLDSLARGCRWFFRGEEYDESHYFRYFTGHIGQSIVHMKREGRSRREFLKFSDFTAEQVPDPGDAVTFGRSELDPSKADPEHLRYDNELIALRRTLPDGLPQVSVDEERRMLRFCRAEVELMTSLRGRGQDLVPPGGGVVRW